MDNGRELKWDDSIEHDGSDFVLLPPGEYPFRVTKFERARYTPGPNAKLPACNQAKLSIEIDGGDAGTTTVFHNLYLHSRTEGLLCAFFRAIGQRQHGQQFRMDWGKVPGATGRCQVGVRKWTGRDGADKESNEVVRFIDPDDQATATATAAAPVTADGLPVGDDIPF